jgi:hypothetical protein
MRAGLIAIPLGLLGVLLGIGFWVMLGLLVLGGDEERLLEAQQVLATPAPQTPGQPTNRTNCDEIFGTPFRSITERQWFLENCTLRAPSFALPQPSGPAPATPSSALGQQPSISGNHRTDCNQIRGTPYQSDAERLWYLANCNTSAARDPGPGPDRTDCNQIRGTAYRSDAERLWFLANCSRR